MNLFTHEKNYNTIDNYYKNKYGCKIFKVSLNIGLGCPHSKTGGCTFCLEGSGTFSGNKKDTLKTQFDEIKTNLHKKWPNAKYISYFQAETNTNAELEFLKKTFEESLELDDNIVGLNISTRPDCITDELLEYLVELNSKTDLMIELGLQTIHNKTLEIINRGHTYEDFEKTYLKLKEHNIKVTVHIINGLPFETKEMMLETVKKLNTLDIDHIKIHMLHIMKNTKLAETYLNDNFKILTLEEYVDITVTQIRLLNDSVIISRLSGDAPNDFLIEPQWTKKKLVVMNEIDKSMRKYNYFQGDLT